MTTSKKIGIWMDHSNAHITEFTNDPMVTKTITSKFTHEEKEHSLSKSESLMHNKEQHQQSEYYKKISDLIRNYESVILFGPTDAKVELLNLLRKNHLFAEIKIEFKQTDKMSIKQQHTFVKEYFLKN